MKHQNSAAVLNCRLSLVLRTSVAVFAMIMATETALAQEVSAEAEDIDEIVVTAQKRTENLRDVPISITAIGAEELKERGIQNVQDIQFGTPNLVTYSTSDINPNIIIRGIGSASRNIGFESTLGIYIDGVYQGRSNGFFSDLDDVERIEVLRGPQGTLFGKNTTAGAINITTTTPSNDLEGNISAGYGNFNAWRVSGGLSGALVTDKVFAKISGFRAKADGTVRNIAPTGFKRVNDEDRYGFRGMLRFTPSENFEFDLRGDLSSSTQAGFEDEVISVQNPLGYPDDSVVPGRRTININGRDETTVKQRGVSGTARLTIGEHILSSITAYRTQNFTTLNADPDNTGFDYLRQDFRDRTRQFSQELQLASPSSGRLKYVLGLYYYNQNSRSDRQTFIRPALADIIVSDFAVSAALLNREDIRTIGSVKTEAWAGYLNASFDVTDRFSIIGGARLTKETKQLNVDQNVPLFISSPTALGLGRPLYVEITGANDKISRSDFSPTLGLQHKLGERINSYFRWSRGFKSAGWNAELLGPTFKNGIADPNFFNVQRIRFGAESVDNYEIGIKGDALDRKLRFSFAGFLTNYSDIQFSRFVGGLIGYATDNSNARIKGFELELNAEPASGFTLSANVGFTDAKYRNNATGSTCGDTCIPGSRLVAPRWTLGLGAGYEAKISENGTLNLRLDYSYRSNDGGFGRPTSSDPTIETRANTNTPGFGLFDGRIAYETGGFEFAIWGKNLLNKNYAVDRLLENNNALLGIVHEGVTYGEPRTFGATASYKF